MTKAAPVNDKVSFKFKIPAKLLKEQKSIYAPPFATASDMFWQLKFHPESKDHKDYCALWLIAIPNKQEKYSAETWLTRAEYSVTYFMKNPDEKLDFGELKNYNAKSPVWGFSKFCKKDRLPQEGEVTIGVKFNKVQYDSERITTPLPSLQTPSNLTKAWKAELNKPEISDVQFDFTNCEGTKCQTLYASSSILSERSIYFNSMFHQGRWSESVKDMKTEQQIRFIEKFKNLEFYRKFRNKTQEPMDFNRLKRLEENTSANSSNTEESINSLNSEKLPLANTEKNITSKAILSQSDNRLEVSSVKKPDVSKKYKVTVSDFHPETFKSMLRFLYTDSIDFHSSSLYRRPIDIFMIADKYLITDLRDRAKTRIFKDLTPKNAIEMLFGIDIWLWDDLKELIISYVVKKFDEVKENKNFKDICAKLRVQSGNDINSEKADIDDEDHLKRELLREIFERAEVPDFRI
ncbi:10066_t:CDS:2 [Acaulospora morrowiae]|uniref:10066_t:CDS:1 n=1 Tax=Acaulospora morrowiae TaxID=94023 RepID=A0A9N9AWY4_9GLOM|nr:10066_t:CDS:2 [Acaulospora morrowiae]